MAESKHLPACIWTRRAAERLWLQHAQHACLPQKILSLGPGHPWQLAYDHAAVGRQLSNLHQYAPHALPLKPHCWQPLQPEALISAVLRTRSLSHVSCAEACPRLCCRNCKLSYYFTPHGLDAGSLASGLTSGTCTAFSPSSKVIDSGCRCQAKENVECSP